MLQAEIYTSKVSLFVGWLVFDAQLRCICIIMHMHIAAEVNNNK